MWASCGEQEIRNRVALLEYQMHKYRQDEWVMYHQFPAADTEWLRRGKRAVILEQLEDNKYRINEAVLKAID